MKILLFTHIADIDGINNIVLAKKAFKKIDYVLCEANEIDKELINNWYKLKNYDYIFITDLCPSDEMALKINNSELVNKLKVFDHHQSALDKLTKKYPFINIKVKDKNGMCCGTSLFYKYLITNNYLKRIITLDKMVELTRKYDTWEWKKDNDVEACYLTYLFNAWGIKKYINKMLNKVDNAIFNFTNKELKTIATWLQEFNAKIKNIVDKMVYIKIDNYKAGIVTSSYQYRNDIAEYIKDNNYNIDFIVIVFNDKNSVSYRAIKENVDVNQIAQRFGGGGHEKAASSPITDAQKKDLIKYLKGGNDIIDEFVYVNKEIGLGKNYKPKKLVRVKSKYKDKHILMLDKKAYKAWLKLKKAVAKKGYCIEIESAYRSYDYQKELLDNLIAEKGAEYAYNAVAKPGHSEHQTGLALDYCIFRDGKYLIEKDIDLTEESIYTNAIAHLYGFILRYPKGKEDITGYMYEPWHLRYVDKDLAVYLYQKNLTLDEYYYNMNVTKEEIRSEKN